MFNRDAFFDGVTFSGHADFYNAMFRGKAYFSEAKFSSHAYFNETKFCEIASLREVTFSSYADFSGSEFKGKIDLEDAVYHRIKVHWKNIKYNLIYQGSTFRSLIENYRNLSWDADANDLYYEYRLKHREELPTHL
jgi:uncharacterized protein YjbI with pentapeptide repeats